MLRVTVAEKGGVEREQFFDVSDLSIGRVQGNSIVLPKPNVSKRHATVTSDGTAVTITDQKSTNGTYVNGRRIAGPRVLSPEDRVYIGDFTLRFSNIAATGDMEPTPVPPLPIGDADPMMARPTISMAAFSPEPAAATMPPVPVEASVQTDVPIEFDVEVAPPVPPPPPPVARPPEPRPESVEVAVSSRVAPITTQTRMPPAAGHSSAEALHAGRSQLSGIIRRVHGAGADRGSPGRWAEALRAISDEAASSVFADPSLASGEFTDEQWQRMSDGVMRLVDRLRREDRLPPDVDPFLLTQDVLYEFTGLGPFEELLADEQVRTIVVDGIDRIWVGRGGQPVPVAKAFASEATQERVLVRLLDLAGLGAEVLHSPVVTCRLPDGTMLRIIGSPLAAEGRMTVIERPHATTLTLDDLVQAGVIEDALATRLKEALALHRSIVVCGGSRERRIAVVNALLRSLPAGDRVVLLDGPGDMSPRRDGAAVLDRGAVNALGAAAAASVAALHPDAVALGDVDSADLPLLAHLATGPRPGLILSASCPADRLPDRLSAAFRLVLPALDDAGARSLVAEVVDVAIDIAAGDDGRSRVARVSEWFEPGRRFGA